MKMRELFSQQKEGVSFEFFPPKTQAGEDQLIRVIDRLGAWSPTFISMTYSAGGSNIKNTPNVIRRIKKEISLMPMPHLSCLGQDNEELEVMLRSYRSLVLRISWRCVVTLRGNREKALPKEIFATPQN
jgi:methylenetetrahydrofolate reductase (NADPH)